MKTLLHFLTWVAKKKEKEKIRNLLAFIPYLTSLKFYCIIKIKELTSPKVFLQFEASRVDIKSSSTDSLSLLKLYIHIYPIRLFLLKKITKQKFRKKLALLRKVVKCLFVGNDFSSWTRPLKSSGVTISFVTFIPRHVRSNRLALAYF